ncbi:MAG: hypothetical protein J6Q81_06325 [Lentisphaeria bacterium]|nr:hypothetical protein [Lentisphaeria bacterium]
MSKLIFLLFSQFLLILLELALGNCGWTLPWTLLGALYITLAFGRNWGIAAALLAGMVLSALYGGSWNLLKIIIYPLLAGAVNWWITQHQEDITIHFWQPGAWAGAAAALPALANMLFRWSESGIYPAGLHFLLLDILWTAAVSAPLFIVIVFLGEAAAEFLGLPRFLTRKGGEVR